MTRKANNKRVDGVITDTDWHAPKGYKNKNISTPEQRKKAASFLKKTKGK